MPPRLIESGFAGVLSWFALLNAAQICR